jgi:pyruvate/2-oxoglutarate/acetoin dehydrogenase E1 component
MSYLSEIQDAMKRLADHPNTLFVGQAVEYDGQAIHSTLKHVPMDRRIEMPVIEDFQAGFCTGLAIGGYIPICIFPRFDFLICATNQIINHLDKLPLMSDFKPKVIIRTSVGATEPLNPGLQHTQNHTEAFREMCHSIRVVDLTNADQVEKVYQEALDSPDSYLIVEHGYLYRA